MATNYSSWSIEKLEKELKKIQKAIDIQKRRNKKAALAKVIAVAKQNGFELTELLDGVSTNETASIAVTKSVKKRAKVKPKYKNPGDETKCWTGRGRQPLWVKAHIDAGGRLEDLAI